ncbi:MAG: hypothetical protein PHE20_03000 [Patescibacteria group bacterium]|nr:hypothetical protein [Patescibacteria group bacterium]
MKKLIFVAIFACYCQFSFGFCESHCRTDSSGMEIFQTNHRYHERYTFNSCLTGALQPISLFPRANFPFQKKESLIKDLSDFKSEEIRKHFSCKMRYPVEFENLVLSLAHDLNGQDDISQLSAKEALTLLANVIRFQLSDDGSDNDIVAQAIEPVLEVLRTRRHFQLSIFEILSADEYFLSGHKKLDYYCGMTSWISVHAFDVFKAHIPSLRNVYMFECGLQGPAHSFNLMVTVDEESIGMYLIDFQKEKFWDHNLIISAENLLNDLDMSKHIELTKISH